MFSKATNISLLNPVTKLNKCSDIKISNYSCFLPRNILGMGGVFLPYPVFVSCPPLFLHWLYRRLEQQLSPNLSLVHLHFSSHCKKKIQKYLVSMMHQKHDMTFWYTVILSILFSCRFGKSQCQKQFKDTLFYIISTNRINKVEYVLVITHVKTINALESVLVEVIRLTFNLVNDLDLNHLSK